MWSQYRFSPSTMKLLPVRSGAFGLYFPVCATTSINKFHVRVCPTSASARAIDFVASSEVARVGTSLAARAPRRAAMARVMSVWLTDHPEAAEQPGGLVPVRTHCVSHTIAFAACIASDVAAGFGAIVGDGAAHGGGAAFVVAASNFTVPASIAASTGAFFV